MKTFDLALKHLKGIDFKNPEIFADRELISRHENFRDDPLNITSNDHYRGMVFYACIYHLHDINNDKISYFYIACEIIEQTEPSHERYMNTEYPKNVVDEWNNYCNSIINAPAYIAIDNEVRFNIFCVAYHYTND